MLYAIVFLFPLLLVCAQPDRLTGLVEEMRQLTFAGDQPAVGRLMPLLLDELAKPHPKAAEAWNQAGVYFHARVSTSKPSVPTYAASGCWRRKESRTAVWSCST